MSILDYTDWDHHEHANILQEKFENEKMFLKDDTTFSDEDVIRIYNNNLTLYEKAMVKEYFINLIPMMVDEINNAQIWSERPEEGYEDKLMETKSFMHVSLMDLTTSTISLIYDIVDLVRDIAMGDIFAARRLLPLYDQLIAVWSNWGIYLDKLEWPSLFGKTTIQQWTSYPWWSYEVVPWWQF